MAVADQSINESRLQEVHTVLAERARKWFQHLEENFGIRMRVTRGLASWNEQNALYAQGRAAPGVIVTKAPGGYSAHNFGYAIDAVPDDPNFPAWTPDWNARDERWQSVLESAERYGLLEGAKWRTFPDKPHFYLRELPATPDDNMRYLYREGGMRAVWDDWQLVETEAGQEPV